MKGHLTLPLLALVGVSGCQQVLGMTESERKVHDSKAADSGVDSETGAPAACSFSDSNALITTKAFRFVNMVPTADTVDFCIKGSSDTDYAAAVPYIRSFGQTCLPVAYTNVLRPKPLDPGKYDFKVVASKAVNCRDALAFAELKGAEISDKYITTIVYAGGAQGIAPQVFEGPEGKDTSDTNLRFMNVVATDERLQFGLAADSKIPTQITAKVSKAGVPFGGVPEEAATTDTTGTVNKYGYLTVTAGLKVSFGASRMAHDPLEAIAATELLESERQVTYFAAGIPGSYDYPVRIIACNESGVGATEQDKHLSPCQASPLPTVTVDAITVGLFGRFAAYEDERRPAVIREVSKLTSDFVCVNEISRDSDRDALVTAGKAASFPYAVNPSLDENTPFTDARDQTGSTPPTLEAPCAYPATALKAADALKCIRDNCTDSNDKLKEPGCMSSKCASVMIPMIIGDAEHKRCVDCLIVNLLSEETTGFTETSCTTDAKAGFAFRGASPDMILSRFPLIETETKTYVLPSSGFRRTVLRSRAQIATNTTVDVYCAHFSFLQGSSFPYAGQYGAEMVVQGSGDAGTTTIKEWSSENYLQAQRTIDWVKANSASDGFAIIAGDLSSSNEDLAHNISPQNPATIQLMRREFPEAVPSGYVPKCSLCAQGENAYGGTKAFWFSHIFTYGRPVSVQSFERILTDNSLVALPAAPFTGSISDNFGVRSTIIYQLGW